MNATVESSQSADGTLTVRLSGCWQTARKAPSSLDVQRLLAVPGIRRIRFDTQRLVEWDSRVVVFVSAVSAQGAKQDINVETENLPDGARRLMALSSSSKRRDVNDFTDAPASWLTRVGEWGLRTHQSVMQTIAFTGELALCSIRVVQGQARFQMIDIVDVVQQCGWQALPIVSLISFLVGLILAFMGAVQLSLFGAQLYVADLVAIGMAREMGAVMTGVIMAGRTGAAFAANIGSMQANEEIDALKTLGVDPVDYLVLPRMIGLMLMMPFLCIYADTIGILGGWLVGVTAFDISTAQYVDQTLSALTVTHVGIGIFKSVVFGLLVAFYGCLKGLHCDRSASGVGQAATAAVVMSIVAIVAADGLFAVLANALRI